MNYDTQSIISNSISITLATKTTTTVLIMQYQNMSIIYNKIN